MTEHVTIVEVLRKMIGRRDASKTLEVLWNVLKPLVLNPPRLEDWAAIADGFEDRWNFPNCIGAIDGKHINIQAPLNSGSTFFNYKGSHSIVLMAVVDSQYQFLLVDIGGQGRQSDGGIFRNSLIGQKIINKTLDIPPPRSISEGRQPLPYVIVGDEAFPLLENLMRPYPGKTDDSVSRRIFNYRLSRARRISENAFGILVARWRIFQHPIISKVDNIENVIKATVCLHNFIIKYDKKLYVTPNLVDQDINGRLIPGLWRENLSHLSEIRDGNYDLRSAKDIREQFCTYFNEEGAVEWQWDTL
ncbi:protein ALP1-like [Sitophilus oryzae]|uniref:Protein ALP1-like n=1 Tax=Sitophilus oryzae TaxID=7048 RepID=A0A6J2YHJ0_SITOR|nr:protein ALP1-like [Sitophilus oryzae]